MLDKGELDVVVAMDLSKAFDVIQQLIYSSKKLRLMVWEREVLLSSRIICRGGSIESRLGTPFPREKV